LSEESPVTSEAENNENELTPLSFVESFKAEEPLLYNLLRDNVVITELTDTVITLTEKVALPTNFSKQLGDKAEKVLNKRWHITINKTLNDDSDTIAETEEKITATNIASFKGSSDFQKIQELFPEAEVTIYSETS